MGQLGCWKIKCTLKKPASPFASRGYLLSAGAVSRQQSPSIGFQGDQGPQAGSEVSIVHPTEGLFHHF